MKRSTTITLLAAVITVVNALAFTPTAGATLRAQTCEPGMHAYCAPASACTTPKAECEYIYRNCGGAIYNNPQCTQSNYCEENQGPGWQQLNCGWSPLG